MLIDIAKLLFQKDTRDTLKELVALVRRNPEWKKDLVNLDERFGGADAARAGVLVRFLRELLVQKGWAERRAGVAEFAIQELVDNAFAHGHLPGQAPGAVRIRAALNSHSVICQISDSGPGFRLADILAAQARGEERGLARVMALAASLVQLSANTVSVTVVSEPGRIALERAEGIHIFVFTGRFTQESFNFAHEFAQMENALAASARMVLDLSDAVYLSSVALRSLMLLEKGNRQHGRQAIMVVRPGSVVSEVLLVSHFGKVIPCVATRAEAIAQLQA